MAAFDTVNIPIGWNTDIKPVVGKRVTTMMDHSVVIHQDSSNEIWRGVVECIHLEEADKTTIQNFYSTNKDISWTFDNPHDGINYDLRFTTKPHFKREPREATVLYMCTFGVIGTQL